MADEGETKTETKTTETEVKPPVTETKPAEGKVEEKKVETKAPEGKVEEKKVDAKKGDKGLLGADDEAAAPVEIKLPEGFEADDEQVKAFSALAGEVGLKSESAQKLFDFYAKAEAEKQEAQANQIKEWETDFKKDPKHKETLALAKRAVAHADPDTKALLEGTLLGSHPGLLRFLAKMGENMQDHKQIDADGEGAKGDKRGARNWFPSMNKA